MRSIRVLTLPKYGRLGASSRLRSFQYVPWLESSGFDIHVEPLLPDGMLRSRYLSGGYSATDLIARYARRVAALWGRKSYDLLWIEKEALPWWPAWIELALLRGVPYVLDYDDAIFHTYDTHPSALIRRVYGGRLDALMASAALVVGGNEYLASRARDAGAPWVEVVPTVVDLERYNGQAMKDSVLDGFPRVVWIGSPATAHYLQLVREPLQALAARMPFVLRVIGGTVEIPGVNVEIIPWVEDEEHASIATADVGIMPLTDSAWERGKCGYKLIQYMACELPVVASPVGVNSELVQAGKNGLLARTSAQWVEALEHILSNTEIRETFGRNGRARVEQEYCLQRTGPRLAKLLRQAALKI